MGKTHKANRTKGNTRPSSSGQCAELLGVGSLGGFVGFGWGKDAPSYVPVTGQQMDPDANVDSDFRMVMRKMLKRDAITRLKAVQEFGDYCVEKDKEIVKNVLPFWPRLFNRLVLDFDRRVREATHTANGKLLQKVKREVAPFLKGIMGAWLVGQCDSHAPASSVAQATFTETFPESKQSGAVLFCKDEVFAYFKDNLFEQTVKSMSDPNTASPEDMESKYNLVVSATLQAIKLFLTIVKTSKPNEAVHQEIASVVDNPKFWKFAKNKESQIRGAWYSLVGSICQVMPAVFGGNVKKLSTTVFSCLSESDPIVAPAVWESALSVAVNIEDCWQGIDIQKVALNQLWLLLQGGGKGNGSTLFPCLLPFLSRLPIEIVEADSFLQQFFSSFVKGLALDSVKRSTTECDAILNAFFECLQFMCCTRLGDRGPPLMENVLLNQVIPLLSCALFNPDSAHLSVSRLCPLVASLLCRLENTIGYKGTVEAFWGRALPLMSDVFSCSDRREAGLVFLAYFFNSLFEGEAPKEKKSVRFREENEAAEEEPPPVVTIKTSQSILASGTSVSFKHIVDFCAKLCGEIEKERSLVYTRLLEEILTSASSEEILEELANRCLLENEKEEGSKSTPKFVEKLILKWLSESKMENEKLDSLVNVTLLACSFLSIEESKKILDLCTALDICIAVRLLCRGLSVCRTAEFFRSWFSGCSRKALSCIEELLQKGNSFTDCEREVSGSADLLKICLMDVDTELLIEDDTLRDLLTFLMNLSKELFDTDMENDNRDFLLLHDLTIAVLKIPQRCWKFDTTEQLIFLIFKGFLSNTELYFVDVNEALYGILEVAIESYITAKQNISAESSLLSKMSKELNNRLMNLESHTKSDIVQTHCLFLLSTVRKCTSRVDPSVAIFTTQKLADTILPSPEEWTDLRKGLKVNFLPFFLQKRLFYPLDFNGEQFSYDQDKVEKLTSACQVVSGILGSDVLAFKNGEEADVPERQHVVQHLPHLLWCVSFCRGTRKRIEVPSENKMFFEKTFEHQLVESWTKMLGLMIPSEIEELVQNIFNMALLDREYAICLSVLGELLPKRRLQSFAEEQFQSSSTLFESESAEKYLLRQLLIPHLSLDAKLSHFEEKLLVKLGKTETVDSLNFPSKLAEVCCCFQDRLPYFFSLEELEGFVTPTFKTAATHLEGGGKQLHSTLRLLLEAIVYAAATKWELYLINSDVWEFFSEELSRLIKERDDLDLSTPCSLVYLHRILCLYSSLDSLYVLSKDQEDLLKWKPPGVPQGCQEGIFNLFVDIAGKDTEIFPSESHGLVLDSLLQAVQHLYPAMLVQMLTDSSLARVVAALSSTVRQVQLGAHSMLNAAMPLLPDLLRKPDDDTEEDQGKKDEFERIPKKLSPLLDKLLSLQEIVETLLGDLKIGDPCSVVPHTDSYCLAMAYLLAWTQVLEFISAAPSQIRLGYATDLTEKGLLPSLFPNVFRLMPENPTVCLKRWACLPETPKKEDMRKLFMTAPCIDRDSQCSEEEIQIVACYVYARALLKVPASVRSWFNNLDRKSADIVNNFTTKYVSSHLCAAEIQEVHQIGKKLENLTVQGRPGSREVVAVYTVDEASIELCLQLPPNHPLSPVATERRGRVGVGEQEWRQWLLQLKTTLTYQNGSLLDGLGMWQRNLQKKFEGVEECMICYYVLHSSTLKLPRLSCHVCRKKFHSECLYKWFRTSNNSTCPLCRNEFHM